MSLSYYNTPFPHIKGSIDQDLYSEFLKEWETVSHKEYIEAAGNRSNIPLTNQVLFSKLRDIILNCHTQFSEDVIKEYPNIVNEKNIELNCRILFSENCASETEYKIRGWHLDTGDKHLVGLWYFKHLEEQDCGGDLVLMNPLTKESETIKYDSNVFVIFPNVMTSWHSVTPRKPSKYPRRYVNLLLESPNVRLHNYQRNGASVDDEFRGKLINYYK